MDFTEMTIEQLKEWITLNKKSPLVHKAIRELVSLELNVLDNQLEKYDTRYLCST